MLGGGVRYRVQRALYGVESYLLKTADRVSTITEAMRRRLVEKGVPEDRTWLLANWSDLQFVRPMPKDDEVRRKFGAEPEDVLVLYTGNMGNKQGLEVVLDAADRLRKRKEIKFAMVGTGVARERLERTVAKWRLTNVRFFPVQSVGLLPSMLAAGDIHLVVQRGEAADLVMPSKLTNILAAGRSCIVTADLGTALCELIDDHECGITTKPDDAKELASSIVGLADDPSVRGRLGRNARRYAEAYLDKDKLLAEFENGLRQLEREKP
jgi:colanic acid biosynthesis glycosyl transferase WcaI